MRKKLIVIQATSSKTFFHYSLPSIFSDMPCSLRSQLQRMFVPDSVSDMVSEDDLIVMSDVDNFVMRPDIFEELLRPENLDKISILQVKFGIYGHVTEMTDLIPLILQNGEPV